MAGKKKTTKKSEIKPLGKGPAVGSDAAILKDSADLRRRAEEMLLKQQGAPDKIHPADVQKLLHELCVHQIELEMQNEELRRTQQELEASREEYFDLYDLAPVGYVSLNEKGIILKANFSVVTLLGRERSHLVGRPLTRFIHREDQDLYYLCHKQVVETNSKQVCEIRMLRKDMVPFWVRIDLVTPPSINGTKELRAIIIDISQRRQNDDDIRNLNKLLNQHVVRLELANEEMEAFSYSVSHDLRAPPSTI